MGYKLIAQITLIVASLVIIYSFTLPKLQEIKMAQNELDRYSEAVTNASLFNARIQELLQIKDSFSQEDLAALEKMVPVSIDQLKVMKDIEGIFANRNISVTSLTAQAAVDPIGNISLERSSVIEVQQTYKDVAYQDFEVKFNGTYAQLRDILILTEASDSLLEVIDLRFDTSAASADDAPQTAADGLQFTIIFRTFGLPIAST